MVLTGSSFKPCDQAAGKIQSVSVEPCESEPCTVSNGDSVDISTNFITEHDTDEDCYLKASFLFSGGWFEILNEPACGDVDCPMKAGSTYTLNRALQVTDSMPVGEQTTKWKLICNGGADQIFCADISIKVV